MRTLLIIAICSMLAATSQAQVGHSVFGFLDFPFSSHANALGGENISIVGTDLSMVSQNPALLGPEMSDQVSLKYMRYLKGVNLGGAQYARAINANGAWAIGAHYLDYGSFTHTSEGNDVLGTFGAKDLCMDATLGYNISTRWRGGATAKFLYSAYESYTSLALAVDLGVNYYNPENTASFSVVVRNLGGQIKKFDEIRESLPVDLQIGYSQHLAHAPFRFSVTAFNLLKWNTDVRDEAPEENGSSKEKKSNFVKDLFRHINIGVDYIYSDNFYAAIGYNYKRQSDFASSGGFLTGFSLGMGLKIIMFDIHASVASHHRSGTSLMFGTNLLLDKF